MGQWEELAHTADLALRVRGADLADLFAAAARGMAAFLVDVDAVPLVEEVTLSLEAPDVEILLVDWLNELLYLGEGDRLKAYVAFEFMRLTPTTLAAKIYGGPVTAYETYIKAATFHNLVVRETPEGWETEIVFDT